VVQSGEDLLIVDAGLPAKKVFRHFAALGLDASKVRGILVSHHHADHAGRAGELSKALHVPVYATSECIENGAASIVAKAEDVRVIRPNGGYEIGSMVVFAEPTYHTPGAVGFLIEHTYGIGLRHSACIFVDVPEVTEGMGKVMQGCELIACESDYLEGMLAANENYDAELKSRIRMTHLSNERLCAFFANGFQSSTLKTVVLLHGSEENSIPWLAQRKVEAALRNPAVQVLVAPRDAVLGPVEV
jgi:phosphoribosyl 1,2-cyclic phosphodiesterase